MDAYPLTIEAALTAIAPNTLKIQALGSGYVYSATDNFADDLSDLLGAAIALASVSFAGGILTAANPTITGLANGDNITHFVVYNDTGTPSTSKLLAHIDEDAFGAPINYTSDGTNLPITFPGVTILSY